MTKTATVQDRAEEALSWFHTTERGGDRIWTRKEDAPSWVEQLTYEAHGDMLPDDFRYEFIVSALDIIAHADEDDYSAAVDGEVDIYNGTLAAWLASNLTRAGYVDEFTEEMGHNRGVMGDIAGGQWQERTEVLSLVLSFLTQSEDM